MAVWPRSLWPSEVPYILTGGETMDPTEIETRFTYHPPSDEQRKTYERIRSRFLDLAHELDRLLPESREKSLAYTKLEEAVMWSNASIARRTE